MIKEFREEKMGWSQEELAEKAGLSRPYVSALERGDRRNPRSDAIQNIADALELEPDERELLRNGFFPALIAEPDEGDRNIQRTADRVWVFSSQPAETRRGGEDYREVITENLKKGVEYVYWTRDTNAVEITIRKVKKDINTESIKYDVDNLVRCIMPPEEVNWFDFAIYWFENSSKSNSSVGRVSLPADEEGEPFQWSISMNDETKKRIIKRCRDVINGLMIKVEDNEEPIYQGYELYDIGG